MSANLNFLRKVALFYHLDNAGLEELSTYLKKVSYPPHHTIFWMDERGDDRLYIIQNGKVSISYHDENGREVTLATLSQGSFFGELSLIDGGTHTATARTLTEVDVFILDRTSFYLFLDKHPRFSHSLLDELTSRLRSSTVKLRGIVNINEEIKAKSSTFQLSVDRLAKALTSGIFLTFSIIFIVVWMAAQVYFFEVSSHQHVSFIDKPPTFFLLGFIITLTSFLLTILILNSQRRQAENDRIRGEIEYQVNLKAQSEVMKMQLKIDNLINTVNELSEKLNSEA